MSTELRGLLERLVRLLDAARVPFMVAGSFASTAHGIPRTTQDLDLVIDPPSSAELDVLVNAMPTDEYYVDVDAAREALRRRTMFNAIVSRASSPLSHWPVQTRTRASAVRRSTKTIGVALWVGAAVNAGLGIGFTLGAKSAAEKVSSARAGSPNPDSSCVGVSSPDCTSRGEAESDRARNTNLAAGTFIGAGALLVAGSVSLWWPTSKATTTRGSKPTIVPVVGKERHGLILRQEF